MLFYGFVLHGSATQEAAGLADLKAGGTGLWSKVWRLETTAGMNESFCSQSAESWGLRQDRGPLPAAPGQVH